MIPRLKKTCPLYSYLLCLLVESISNPSLTKNGMSAHHGMMHGKEVGKIDWYVRVIAWLTMCLCSYLLLDEFQGCHRVVLYRRTAGLRSPRTGSSPRCRKLPVYLATSSTTEALCGKTQNGPYNDGSQPRARKSARLSDHAHGRHKKEWIFKMQGSRLHEESSGGCWLFL